MAIAVLCCALLSTILLLLVVAAKEDPKGKLVWTVPNHGAGGAWKSTLGLVKRHGKMRGQFWRMATSRKSKKQWATSKWPSVEGLNYKKLFFDENGRRRVGED